MKHKAVRAFGKLVRAFKAVDYEDLVWRAFWTFLEGFGAVFLFASDQIIDTLFMGNWEDAYALILATAIGGVAAGLSALKTLTIEVVKDIKKSAEA